MIHALQTACYGEHTHIINWMLTYTIVNIYCVNLAFPRFAGEISPITMASAQGHRNIVKDLLLLSKASANVGMCCTGKDRIN